jgi:hypothetical protein
MVAQRFGVCSLLVSRGLMGLSQSDWIILSENTFSDFVPSRTSVEQRSWTLAETRGGSDIPTSDNTLEKISEGRRGFPSRHLPFIKENDFRNSHPSCCHPTKMFDIYVSFKVIVYYPFYLLKTLPQRATIRFWLDSPCDVAVS